MGRHFDFVVPSTWGTFTHKLTTLGYPELSRLQLSGLPLLNLQALVAMGFGREFAPSHPIETTFFLVLPSFFHFFSFLFHFFFSFYFETSLPSFYDEKHEVTMGRVLPYSYGSRNYRLEDNQGFKDRYKQKESTFIMWFNRR